MADGWSYRQVHKWTGGLSDCQIGDRETKILNDGVIDNRLID
jgi:hypothetical protein